uniref:Cell cycle checkpoint protein RAD17 isoform X4 n=1 Tax=Geotrypetes seraphini TaxID=260995 RepID=A0A6P8P285_GEOSA|nr:cell cycle checkpoint protein RAD17 isoform X4 [Geotrypetes seraphini]
MSTTSYRSKIASAKLTDWVEPSFEDLCGISNSSFAPQTKPSGLVRRQQKNKEHPLFINSSHSEFQKTKRSKYFSREKSSSQIENDPWVVKYKPETQTELAVHKKKIEEVEVWLKAHAVQRQPKQGGSLLLLTGPPGCGKTATVQVLAKDLGVQLQEWINPILMNFRRDDVKNIFDCESSCQMFSSQSQTGLFQEFLLRANKYTKLQMVGDSTETDRKLILVEDMPNIFYREPASLHQILRRFVQTGRCPLVFIVSDSISGDINQRLLFPKEIQEELSFSNISFNPVAPTSMMKVLNRIATSETNWSGGRVAVPDKTALELLCCGSSGDIRNAINSLHFSSLTDSSLQRPNKREKTGHKPGKLSSRAKQKQNLEKSLVKQEHLQAIGGKDASLFLFRALGKILYCKREPATESNLPRLPLHLSVHERDPLLVEPESRAALREYSASVATRGVMHSNTARAYAHCQGRVGFKPLHKPQWLLINKKYRENCLAAKTLFSNFCLTSLCLQTQLLPYLALLTNPMRNQAQIAFIQDIGRLPLKRHFWRLKLESLTDRDPGVLHQDSGDEDLDSTQLGQVLAHAKKNDKINEPASEESCLPASQPEPCTSQVFMEEEDIQIEEYYSD